MPTQFGGYQRQQTLFATQLLRAFVRTAEHQNISTTILFLDVRSAFHCMLREHVFGNDGSLPERVKQCLFNSGLDPHAINELTTQYAADFVHTADPCLQRITQDAHSHTWYTLAHHDLCYKTHRGSRPGSPLADLAYNTMMQPLLEEIQNVMMCDEVHHSACANLGLASAPIAWVDDVAIPIVDMNASKLDDTTIRILQKVDTIFQQHGLSLNYAAGKTEAIMQYRGSAAPAMRERRFVEHLGRLHLGADKFLRTVAEYQYLGTSFSQVVSIDHELKVRLAKAGAAYRLLRKQLFMNMCAAVQAVRFTEELSNRRMMRWDATHVQGAQKSSLQPRPSRDIYGVGIISAQMKGFMSSPTLAPFAKHVTGRRKECNSISNPPEGLPMGVWNR